MGLAIIVIGLGTAGLGYFANKLNLYISYFAPPLAIICGVLCLRQGYQPAKYFLFAWMVLLIGSTLYGLAGNYIPRNFLTMYMLATGSALESILLSFALADRIRSLQHESKMLHRRERRYQELSVTDPLTELYNTRFFESKLANEIEHARRMELPLSVLFADVDHFKRFNDSYGHLEGDKVLRKLSEVIRQCVRDRDCACRYGGEEFTILLPGSTGQSAFVVAERLCNLFDAHVFRMENGNNISCSISIGVAQLQPDDSPEHILKHADEAMYRAKNEGRNRVCLWTEAQAV